MTVELLTTLGSMGLGALMSVWGKSLEQRKVLLEGALKRQDAIDDSHNKAAFRYNIDVWYIRAVRPLVTVMAMMAFFAPVFMGAWLGVSMWVETCQLSGGFWSFLPWVEATEKCKWQLLSSADNSIHIMKEHKQVALAIVGFWFGGRAIK